jgi:hypothetical protein
VRLIQALELASLPGEAVALFLHEMSYQEMQDVQTVRDWKASKVMGLG